MSSKVLRTLSLLVFVCAAAAARAQEAAPTPTPTPTSDAHVSENVVVKALRADDVAPVTKTDLDRPALAAKSWGQEMPVLLQESPSVTAYSETGSGQGYAYLHAARHLADAREHDVRRRAAERAGGFGRLHGRLREPHAATSRACRSSEASGRRPWAPRPSRARSTSRASTRPARRRSTSSSARALSARHGRARTGTAGRSAAGWRLSLRPSWQTTDGFREQLGREAGQRLLLGRARLRDVDAAVLGLRGRGAHPAGVLRRGAGRSSSRTSRSTRCRPRRGTTSTSTS